mmetsp:Transcript_10165/g.9855  ORF Transcript_10165/g.9855 Transcript_10165/m.9855 type:complete len:114 (+) Transcript_10165:121-462(+)
MNIASTPPKLPRTCRTCKMKFTVNSDRACIHHPESFSGETAQRWLPPGVTEGGAVIHNFYTCCGNRDQMSLGCCWMRHLTYDDAEEIAMRRPGMGIDSTVLDIAKNIEVAALK